MTSLGKANWCPRVRQWVAVALFSYYVAGLGAERPLGAGDATNYETLCRHEHRYCVETSGCPGGERSQFSQPTFGMKMAWCRRRGVRVCIDYTKTTTQTHLATVQSLVARTTVQTLGKYVELSALR